MNDYKKHIKHIASLVSEAIVEEAVMLEAGGTSLFKDMTINYAIPRTNAVAKFCKNVEELMREKGYNVEELGEGTFTAEAIYVMQDFPKSLKRLTGYELVSVEDGEPIMSDDSQAAIKLDDGNFLIIDFDDADILYRKFGSPDGGL